MIPHRKHLGDLVRVHLTLYNVTRLSLVHSTCDDSRCKLVVRMRSQGTHGVNRSLTDWIIPTVTGVQIIFNHIFKKIFTIISNYRRINIYFSFILIRLQKESMGNLHTCVVEPLVSSLYESGPPPPDYKQVSVTLQPPPPSLKLRKFGFLIFEPIDLLT